MEWTLEPEAERDYLLPFLIGDDDDDTKNRVRAFIAGLIQNPMNREHLEDPEDSGIFTLERVHQTKIGLVWTLNWEERQVVLAFVGEIPGGLHPPI